MHISTLLCQYFTHNMLCRQRRYEAAKPASPAAQGDAMQQHGGMTQPRKRRASMHLAAKQPNPNYKAHSFQHTQEAFPDRFHYLADQPATTTSCSPAVLQCITNSQDLHLQAMSTHVTKGLCNAATRHFTFDKWASETHFAANLRDAVERCRRR